MLRLRLVTNAVDESDDCWDSDCDSEVLKTSNTRNGKEEPHVYYTTLEMQCV